MPRLRALSEDDVVKINQWPPYQGDMAQMDYALREKGWLEECRSKPDVTLYAVDDGDDLIGFTILEKKGAQDAEFRIALRSDKTGRGLGECITGQTLRIGFEGHGFSRIHLIVRKNNTRGIRLYRRIGFTDCGVCTREILGAPVEFRVMEMRRAEFERLRPAKAAGAPCGTEQPIPQRPRRALLVIDVQNDYVCGNLPIEFPPVELSLANIGRAMDAAGDAGVPVVVVQNLLPEGAPFMARGTEGAELHEAVRSRGRDLYLLKNMPSAFANTGLEQWLREKGIDTIGIAGYMSHNCDLATVLHAMHAGFAVEFLADATGSLPYSNRAGSATAEEIHRVVTVLLQARFAAVLTTGEWIDTLISGAEPERDTIFMSNRRARGAGECCSLAQP